MSKEYPQLSDQSDVALSNADLQQNADLGHDILSAPVAKLDADQYIADDLDGVTESLFGSGNLNFLVMQVGQTNAALINNAAFSPANGSFHLGQMANNSGMSMRAAQPTTQTDTGGAQHMPLQVGEARAGHDGQDGHNNGTLGTLSRAERGANGLPGLPAKGADAFGGGGGGQGGGDGHNGHDGTQGGSQSDVTNIYNEIHNDTPVTQVTNTVVNLVDNTVNTVVTNLLGDTIVQNTVHSVVNTVITNVTNIIDILHPPGGGGNGPAPGPVDHDLAIGGTVVPGTNLILDPVEDVIGDVDVKTTVGAMFGPGDYHNGHGDQDATVKGNIDLIGGDLVDLNLHLPLDPVEAIVGDIDIGTVAAGNLLDAVAPGLIDSLNGGSGSTTIPSVVGSALHDVAETILGQNNNDGGHDSDTASHIVIGNTDVGDIGVVLDPVENLVGDIDLSTDTTLLGQGETSNAAGDSDVTLDLDTNIIGGDLGQLHLDIPLGPVEAIVGDIDLNLGAATDLLGQIADPLLNTGHGGNGADTPLSQVGAVLGDTVGDLIGTPSNDGGQDGDLGLGLTIGGHDIGGGSLVLDAVEDVAGDIDLAAGGTLFGPGETDNAAGDSDISLGVQIGGIDLGQLEISLDPVETITGDIDLNLGAALDPLGLNAGPLVNTGNGGTASDSALAQLGQTLGEVVGSTGVLPAVEGAVNLVTGGTAPLDAVTEIVESTLDQTGISKGLETITQNLADPLQQAGDSLVGAGTPGAQIVDAIGELLHTGSNDGGLLPTVQAVADDTGDFIHDHTGVDTLLGHVGDTLTGGDPTSNPLDLQPLADTVGNALNLDLPGTGVPDYGAAVVDDITGGTTPVQDIVDAVSSVVNGGSDPAPVNDLVQTVVTPVQDIADAVVSAVNGANAPAAAAELVNSAGAQITDALTQAGDSVNHAIGDIVSGQVTDALQSQAQGLVDGLLGQGGNTGGHDGDITLGLQPGIVQTWSDAYGLGGVVPNQIPLGQGLGIGLGLDPVESLAGDLDLGTHIDVLGTGNTNNNAGDSDLTLLDHTDILGGGLAEIGAGVNLDPVEAVVGDIDITLGAADNILGSIADPLVNSGAGGTGGTGLLAQLGQDVASIVNAALPGLAQGNTAQGDITLGNTINSNNTDIITTPVSVVTTPLATLTGSNIGVHIDNALHQSDVAGTTAPTDHDLTVSPSISIGSTPVVTVPDITIPLNLVEQVTGNIDTHVTAAVDIVNTSPISTVAVLGSTLNNVVNAVATTTTVATAVADVSHAVTATTSWTESTISNISHAISSPAPTVPTPAAVLPSPIGKVATGLGSLLGKTSALDTHHGSSHGLFG